MIWKIEKLHVLTIIYKLLQVFVANKATKLILAYSFQLVDAEILTKLS